MLDSRPASGPATAGPAEVKLESMGEEEMRSKLRTAFAKFDLDGSGSISTSEMTKAVQDMGLAMTPEQLATMMKEADPDLSGEIEFEEFAQVLRRQMATGGRFAQIMAGFLNPLAWLTRPSPASPEPKVVTV